MSSKPTIYKVNGDVVEESVFYSEQKKQHAYFGHAALFMSFDADGVPIYNLITHENIYERDEYTVLKHPGKYE